MRLSGKLSQKEEFVSNIVDQSWISCTLFVDRHRAEAVIKKKPPPAARYSILLQYLFVLL